MAEPFSIRRLAKADAPVLAGGLGIAQAFIKQGLLDATPFGSGVVALHYAKS
ncbi:MAG TPA: hypothetical protein VGJ22_13670 [Anaerolineales bacterium]